MILCELMRLQCIYIFFFTLFWGLYSDCIQAVNVALPLYCRCSCVFSKSFKSAHDPLLTKWIPCAQILQPPPLFSWTCSICVSSHSKGRIYSNPKKTITFFLEGGIWRLCSLVTKSAATRWDVSVDGCFIGLTRCQTHLVSFSAAGEEISTLLAALLLCHLGFVHPRWPKYAFFFFFLLSGVADAALL